MEIVKYVGLVLFAVPFVLSGIAHLRYRDAMAGYAQFKRIQMPMTSTVVTGVLLILAPMLVIAGVIPKIALAFLALFLLGTAVLQINFNKNIGLAGAALALLVLL